MTSKQMKATRENGDSKSDFALIRVNAAAGIEPAQDNDSPDATALMQEVVKRGRGRPANSGNTEPVFIRFDKSVLEAFKATGRGWQTRINEVLREYVAKH